MAPAKDLPKAPESLSTAAKKLWKEVVSDFVLEPHHERLLEKALVQWDRSEQAKKALATEGLTVLDRFGQLREHPLVGVERQATLAYLRIMRELGLDVVPTESRGHSRPGAR